MEATELKRLQEEKLDVEIGRRAATRFVRHPLGQFRVMNESALTQRSSGRVATRSPHRQPNFHRSRWDRVIAEGRKCLKTFAVPQKVASPTGFEPVLSP